MPRFGSVSWPDLEKNANLNARRTESSSKRGCVLPISHDEIAALIEVYADRLVRYAFHRLGNLQDAEDVVQEVFARTFSDRSKYDDVSAIGPYLYRSVANASTDLLRKRNSTAVFCEEVDAEELLTPTDGPAEVAQTAEGLRRAETWLNRLPKEQSEAIRLRVFDGLSLNEIAAGLDCPVNTICSRLRYGFQKLRRLVAANKE